MENMIWLPNKHGHYVGVAVPKYLDEVLFDRRYGKCRLRIKEIGHYWYRIDGWNPGRRAYGIEQDITALKRFLDRFSIFDDGSRLENITEIKYHKERKNYYVNFKMVDPYAQAMERAGLVVMK